jgi:hypothetical protein
VQKAGCYCKLFRNFRHKNRSKSDCKQWFWIMVILQGYWFSTTASRNWTFLWSSQHAPPWVVVLLVIIFFVGVWSGSLAILARLTRQHSWIIPIFAIGLGAPAWCQMLWGISGVGHHIPWAGAVGGAILSRCIWLWLGVLHALQDVGFGMILLMTLTRLHIAFVFVTAQIIGSCIAVLARATSPNKRGDGEVFLNLAGESILKPWFWVCLLCQLIICAGYFKVCCLFNDLGIYTAVTDISSTLVLPQGSAHEAVIHISQFACCLMGTGKSQGIWFVGSTKLIMELC